MDGWMYKLMALDPVSKLYFMISKLSIHLNLTLECVVNFLKPIVEDNNIKILSADDAKINKKASNELNLEFSFMWLP